VAHEIVKDREHVLEKLKEIENLGGEGLMLRRAGSYVFPPSIEKSTPTQIFRQGRMKGGVQALF
jgi:hypothetical protein